ncbi:unnamed protein product [Oikopleura dioica]|uniref:EF-hand domain-containing protein n=1 Tax=Oikopleura dioica TaxID=34765 RepID=E4XTR3_OIKDI|nr:unnamed protein product [Oikopleura dioica]
MMKTVVIPIMKNWYPLLNHELMHQEMEDDQIQMKFVDRYFDFCAGEENKKMSFEDEGKCSEKVKEIVADYLPDDFYLVEQHDQELVDQLNELFDVDQDGYLSRSEFKKVFYCYLRIGFQKLIDSGIVQDDVSSAISSLATKIPEIMNSDEAKSYFEEHRRLYQILQMRFNKVRLENLFKNVEPTSRGMTKFYVKLMDEFSDFAAEVYQDY